MRSLSSTTFLGRAALVLLVAWSFGCAKSPRAEPRPPAAARVPSPASASPAPRRPPEAWTEALELEHGVADFGRFPEAVVHAPRGFDASAPLHLVFVLHGAGGSALLWAGNRLPDPNTGEPVIGWGGEVRHDMVGSNSLFIAPQFEIRGGRRYLGRFANRGAFRAFIDELLRDKLARRLGGPRSLRDVASVTLIGSSAGGPAIANLIDQDDLDGRVQNVVLFDAIYGSESIYARWLRGGDAAHPRRFVCIHGGGRYTAGPASRLASSLRASLGDAVVVQPRGAMEDAVRAHRAVFATVNCEHICMGLAYLDKVLRGFDLPQRAPDPDPKTPTNGADPSPPALALGETREGRLDASDRKMRDGSSFDDHALRLGAGESVTIELRGGATRGFLCRSLDVRLRVLDGGRTVADDDDSAGGLASRVTLRATRDTTFTLRVMSHGPWGNHGDYRLSVSTASAPGT